MLLGISLIIAPFFILFAIYRNVLKTAINFFISAVVFVFIFFIIMNNGIRWFLFYLDIKSSASYIGYIKFYSIYYGQFIISTLLLNFCHVKFSKYQDFFRTRWLLITVMMFIGWFFILGLFWAVFRFPIRQPRTVFFVMSNGVKGGVSGSVISTFLFRVLLPCVLIVLLLFGVRQILIKKGIYPAAHVRGKRHSLYGFIAAASCIVGVSAFLFIMRPWMYLVYYYESLKPAEDSEFYKEEFVDPKDVVITFPEKKRNVIYILMESLESSFVDSVHGGKMDDNLLPHLTEYAREGAISFRNSGILGGGTQVEGTGWTIAGILSKMAGIHFKLPTSKNPSQMQTFLPGATTLTDILYQNGYNQLFICGSDKTFASRDVFFETHGNVEVHDINYYKAHGRLASKYHNLFWGFEDYMLYDFAKQDILTLAEKEQPFAAVLLTVDTHYPEGFLCKYCPNDYEGTDPRSRYKNIVKCADAQVSTFIEWIKEQSFYEDTLIVVAGDHLFMEVPSFSIFDDTDYDLEAERNPRYWINLFINSSIETDYEMNRKFSSFDMFPSVLEAMGVTIEGRRLGFGRSLFSGKKTLLEKFGLNEVDAQLRKNTKQYNRLLRPSATLIYSKVRSLKKLLYRGYSEVMDIVSEKSAANR